MDNTSPITHPAPHDGKQYTIPHVVRSLLVPPSGHGSLEAKSVLISLPKLQCQKDWQ